MNFDTRKIFFLLVVVFAISISVSAQSKFDACLDKEVKKEELVAGSTKITVEKRLSVIKARCRRGILVDAKRREIRFFRPGCWGNPPADYLEIQQRERAELARLRKKYTVLEIACPPTGMLPY